MELIKGFILAVLGIVGAAISRQLTDEYKAWTPWIVKHLIRRAVRKLCEEQKERFEEEWFAHVNEIPGEIGKLVAALGFIRASYRMPSIQTVTQQAFSIMVILIFLSFELPIFLFIAALIKLEDGGPIFVMKNVRCCRDGRVFQIIKFRTTVLYGPPSQTRVGRFIARQRLDNLAILIYILNGNLSLPNSAHYLKRIAYLLLR